MSTVLDTLLCPAMCSAVSQCRKLLCLCGVLWTVHYLIHVLCNPLVLYIMRFCSRGTCTGYSKSEMFYCFSRQISVQCRTLADENVLNSADLRPGQQQHGMSAIIVLQPLATEALAAAVAAVKVVHRAASHWLAADQVS